MIKRIICFFKGHKWEAYYRGNNRICGRCEKVVSLPKRIKEGRSLTHCPDGQRHRKQWFECQPGAWKCHRCGCVYGHIGIFDMDITQNGQLKI